MEDLHRGRPPIIRVIYPHVFPPGYSFSYKTNERAMAGNGDHFRPSISPGTGSPTFRQNAAKRGSSL